MKSHPLYTFVILCSLLYLQTSVTIAQPAEEIYRLETLDGSVFFGSLISQNPERVTLYIQNLGEITINRANIKSMNLVDADRVRGGVYWFENPHGTRYFFAPSAIGLRRGQGYYQNTWILFNNANYGVTDNFSIGAGIVPMFLFGVSETPVWLLPKFSLPLVRENVHLSVGALAGTLLGTNADGGFGIVYGTATYGTFDRNLSAGIGYGFAGSEWSQTPMLNISGMIRTSRTFYIVTENYLFPGADDFLGFGSLGVRWAPEIVSIDFALVRPFEDAGGFIGIPWLGLAIPFGR